MIIKATQFKVRNADESMIRLRCPGCRQNAALEKVVPHDLLLVDSSITFGQRRCPVSTCHTHVFFVFNSKTQALLASYPVELIDFDTSDIPDQIRDSFNESIICFANHCYTASAIMVRKTLEEICADRKATGTNLKVRLAALRDKIVLPVALLDGLNDLRLLGNDAAHFELNDFDNIGEHEVGLAIQVTKEVLKSVYQYEGLVRQFSKFKKGEKADE